MRWPSLLLVAALVAGCSAGASTTRTASGGPTAATDPHPSATTKRVSFNGVQVEVPASWPVLGGNKTPLCEGSWPATATVFVGLQPEQGISCPAPLPSSRPTQLDGMWMQPGPTAPPSGLVAHTLPAGQQVEETPPPKDGPGTELLFHRVWIEIGPATPPSDAASLLGSLSYSPTSPDSPVQDACATNPDYAVMPTPTRLDRPMVLEQGDITLDPPRPADRASVPATVAWDSPSYSTRLPTSTYQLLLARYSSKYPAVQSADGSLVPQDQNILAWVLYSHPVTTSGGCGFWTLDVYDAHTGKPVGGAGWGSGS